MSTPLTYRELLIDRYRLLFDWVPDASEAVLDIGCGNAVFTQWLSRKVAFVSGTDHFAPNLAAARREFPQLHLLAAAAEHLPFPDSSFDVTIMSDVLEHVDDDRAALGEALRVLRPGGRLLISLPHRGPLACLDGDNLVNRLVQFLSWLHIPKGRHADGRRRYFFEGFQFVKHRHYGLDEVLALAGDAAQVEKVYYGGTFLWPLLYLTEKILEVFGKRSLVNTDYRRLRRLRAWDFRHGFGRWSYNLIICFRRPDGQLQAAASEKRAIPAP